MNNPIINMIVKLVYIAFALLIVNIIFITLSVFSVGILLPFGIFMLFIFTSYLITGENYIIVNLRKIKSILLFYVILIIVALVTYTYGKNIVLLSQTGYGVMLFALLIVFLIYSYLFITYFLFLTNESFDLKSTLFLSLIAPVHNLKVNFILVFTLISYIVILVQFPFIIIFIGIGGLFVVSNIVLINYKEDKIVNSNKKMEIRE